MKKLIILTFSIIIAILGILIHKITAHTNIVVKFKELRPTNEKLFVYYKGVKIGEAREKKQSDDFTYTLVKVVLYPKKLKLPENMTVVLKKDKTDYMELIYPEKPSGKYLKDGSIIDGKETVDANEFLSNQNPDTLNQMRENILSSTENLNTAITDLSALLVLLQDVIKDNQSNLKASSSNLAQTTGNINQITTKINTSIEQEKLNKSMSNIDSSISSLNQSSKNLEKITENLTVTTNSVNEIMPEIDSAIYQTQGILSNVDEITGGVKEHFKKRFGGFRILFGVTVKPQKEETCVP